MAMNLSDGNWVMPEWMEQYRDVIDTCNTHISGPERVEDAVNEDRYTMVTDPTAVMNNTATRGQVRLLERLHDKGLLGRRNATDDADTEDAEWRVL